MEKRIELEKRGKSPAQIKDLNLDNCRSTQIVGLTDEFVNLETLSLINVGLVTLKGFPKLPNLKRLELSDNRISGGLHWLHGSPKLAHLNLSGNKIKDIETLKPLEEFKNLKNLDLYTCEVTNVEHYRGQVFGFIKSLKSLDGFDRDDKEVDSEVDDEEVNEDDDDAHEDADSDDEDEEEGEDEENEDDVNVDEEEDDDDIDDEDEDEDSEGNEFNEDDDEEEEEGPRGQKRKREGEDDD